MRYLIGTRGSQLALVQANFVRDTLAEHFPEHSFEIEIVKTTGDRVTDRPLRQVGTTGVFTRELEARLNAGDIALAIHSMKDLPSVLPEGMSLVAAGKRAEYADAFISRNGKCLSQLPQGAIVGTSSLRRTYQLLRLRPDLRIVDLRGNIDTRLRKMEDQKLDGIVLAAAGLQRIGRMDVVTELLDVDIFIPSATQGILGAEFCTQREDVAGMLSAIVDEATQEAAVCERAFLARMQVGCHMPVGALCRRTSEGVTLTAMLGNEDGTNLQFVKKTAAAPEEAVDQVCTQLEANRSASVGE